MFFLIIIVGSMHEIDSLIYIHYQTSIVLYMPLICFIF